MSTEQFMIVVYAEQRERVPGRWRMRKGKTSTAAIGRDDGDNDDDDDVDNDLSHCRLFYLVLFIFFACGVTYMKRPFFRRGRA